MTLEERKNSIIRNFIADGFNEKTMKVYKFKEDPFGPGQEKLGVVAEHKTACNYGNGKPKKAYYLEGSPFEMGYLLGLMAERDIARMTGEYVNSKLKEFLSRVIEDNKKQKTLETLIKFILDWYISLRVHKDIPPIYDRELEGIVEGCQRARVNTSVNKARLWMLNVGFDCLLSVVYSGKFMGVDLSEAVQKKQKEVPKNIIQDDLDNARTKLQKIQTLASNKIEPENFRLPMMCNGFVAFGDAVVDNGYYFGRDFMFGTGGVFHDTACMIIYNPSTYSETEAKSRPFVCMTAPGIIGGITIMNSAGLAAGVDMAAGANCNPDRPGLNSLLLLRHVVQHAVNADEAINLMENAVRGVSWNYILADYANSRACIVEAGASTEKIDFLQYPDKEIESLLPSQEFLDANQTTTQRHGLMVRWHDYKYPIQYIEKYNNSLFARFNKTYSPASFGAKGYLNLYNPQTNQLDHNCPEAFYFAPQRECHPNVVVVSNHFLIPEMRLCSMNSWTNRLAKPLLDDIQWRYDELNSQIMEVLDKSGKIDYKTARQLIDFLSPQGKFKRYYENNPKYAGEIIIDGSVTLCDLKKLTMESHYGYYCDEWVKINLARFIF